MNEFYAADPDCFQSVGDLRYLLRMFGPQAGRYLAAYPTDWRQRVLAGFSGSTMDQKRVERLLQEAAQSATYLSKPTLPWSGEQCWVENALSIKKMKPRQIDEVIGASDQAADGLLLFDDLSLPPTADERIDATPEEYERVTRTLMTVSGELFLVDPYLNPCKDAVKSVLERLLSRVASGRKCVSVVCYSRASNVVGDGKGRFSWNDIESGWRKLLDRVQWNPRHDFRFVLVDDELATCKMHGRYLFSRKGGIRLDQGFQTLPKGRKVDVSPVGRSVHDELLATYLEGRNDMTVAYEFR